MTERPSWTGKPVTCALCLQATVPFHDDDDRCWRMPAHPWDDTNECGPCPRSYSVVTAPATPAAMEDRIEAHMVAAMPPEYQDIPEASRAVQS